MMVTIPLESGCYYHIYNRGNNGDILFKEQSNYAYFLSLIKKHILPVAELYAYCLLNNHFHLLIKIKEEQLDHIVSKSSNPEQYFSNFFNAYAKAFNLKYNRTGKLFEERFKRKKVNDEFYFSEIVYYIHSNPQKHKLLKDFRKYSHSSYKTMLSLMPTELKRKEVLEWFGGKDFFEKYHEDRHRFIAENNAFEDFS